MNPASALVAAIAAMACLGLQGCGGGVSVPEARTVAWDTTFQVASIRFPNDSAMARSVVNDGNPYRLSRFFAKCAAGRAVRLGFIGGSITQGAQASRSRLRYTSRATAFLGKMFPETPITEINAGIGATNSRFACSRVKEDLLDQGPDLIVLEFAVNDDHENPDATLRTMEGLIRQCLKAPEVPVILFQTMDSAGSHVNHEMQDSLARHYGLPVIGYHEALRPLVRDGDLAWSAIAADVVHPNDQGHLICGYLLYAFLKNAQAASLGNDPPLAVPAPLADDLYERARILERGDTSVRSDPGSGWVAMAGAQGRTYLVSSHPGDRLVLRTRARELTLLYRYAKTLDARVEMVLDGRVLDTLKNHFAEDWGGGFLKPRQVWAGLEPEGHVLELTQLSGGEFDLEYVLYCE